MVSSVAPLVVWVSVALCFAVGLAGVMQMAGPAPVADDLSGVIRLPHQLTATIASLFGLAVLVFLADLVRRARSRRANGGEAPEPEAPATRIPPWLRTLSQVLSLLNFAVLAYLLWRGVIPLSGLLPFGPAGGFSTGLPLSLDVPASAPAVVIWIFGALALAAALGALALALWVAFADRLVPGGETSAGEAPLVALEAAVDESLEDLRAEPDPRRAIVRCYARFERAAADCGVARRPWLTSMEFMREALARLPIPRAATGMLTSLFELARFSHHSLGSTDRERALAALDEIRAAVDTRLRDAAPR